MRQRMVSLLKILIFLLIAGFMTAAAAVPPRPPHRVIA